MPTIHRPIRLSDVDHVRLVAEFDVNEVLSNEQWQLVLEPLKEALRALPFLRDPVITLQLPPDSLTPLVAQGSGRRPDADAESQLHSHVSDDEAYRARAASRRQEEKQAKKTWINRPQPRRKA